jgi:hypothetical protein
MSVEQIVVFAPFKQFITNDTDGDLTITRCCALPKWRWIQYKAHNLFL